MAKKKKYYICINGKHIQVSKEEYEKRYPPIVETEQTEETTE